MHGQQLSHNFRPIQDLGDRIVIFNVETLDDNTLEEVPTSDHNIDDDDRTQSIPSSNNDADEIDFVNNKERMQSVQHEEADVSDTLLQSEKINASDNQMNHNGLEDLIGISKLEALTGKNNGGVGSVSDVSRMGMIIVVTVTSLLF